MLSHPYNAILRLRAVTGKKVRQPRPIILLTIATLSLEIPGALRPARAADAPLQISYNLTKGQRVSINIYDAAGHIVRELIHAAARPAGKGTEPWDGRDDSGNPVPAGSYTWKLLAAPGFGAEYITSPGSNYAVDNTAPFWAQSPGSHGGPQSIAVDGDGVYVGGFTENIETCVLKQNLSGTQRLWSVTAPAGWAGANCLASVGGVVWVYTANKGNVYSYDAGNSGRSPQVISASFNNEVPNDMAVDAAHLIFCYPKAGLVRWLDRTGAQTRSVNVPGAASVDVGPDGTVYVASGTNIVRIAPDGDSAVNFAGPLSGPGRAAVNPKNGDIYVVDSLPDLGAQIKRYSKTGELLKTYGAPGGRKDGLYIKTDFRGVTDIAVDGSGDFWVTEGNAAPRRTAHFDVTGKPVAEWYGGQPWAPWITPEPDNPSYVWMCSSWGGMMRMHVDFANKTWTVDSCYQHAGMANGMVPSHTNGEDWVARVHNGTLYLCRVTSYPMVIKVDREKRRLLPAAIAFGELGHDPWRYPDWLKKMAAAAGNARAALWTDINGDGLALNADGTPQTNELTFFPMSGAHAANPWADDDLGYVTDGGAHKFAVTAWNAAGSPVYGGFPASVNGPSAPPRLTGRYDDRWSTFTATDSAGNTWGAFNSNLSGWGTSTDAFLARWNPDGSLAWEAGHKGDLPGNTGTLRHIFGVIDNGEGDKCVVASRFAYEWVGEGITPVYVYDQDGLYVGQLIGKPLNTEVASWKYGLGGEALSGRILRDAAKGVYFYGQWINEGRIYKITGWSGWQRSAGSVKVPANYDAPARIPELPGPTGNGTGLLAQYWVDKSPLDPGFEGEPAITRVEAAPYNAGIDFVFSCNPPIVSPTGSQFWSARWTGTLTPRRTGWHMFNQSRGFHSPNAFWVNDTVVSPSGVTPIGLPYDLNSKAGRAIWLEAGKAYPIRVDYETRPVPTQGVLLQWSEPETNGAFTNIPTSQLNPAPLPAKN